MITRFARAVLGTGSGRARRALLGAAAALVLGGVPSIPGATAAASPAPSPEGPTIAVFGQQWQPWGPTDLGSSTSTVASEGCALTASAMLLRAYGVNTNPGALNLWLTAHSGYVDQDLLVWGAVAQYAKAQGVSLAYTGWESYSATAVDGSLNAGNPVIAQVSLDGNMHFVLITGLGPDGTLWINDPWYGDHTTFQSRYGSPATGVQSIRLYSGTPVAAPYLSPMAPGGEESLTAPAGGFGTGGSGSQLRLLDYSTPTSQWISGTAVPVGTWSDGEIAFSAPATLEAGFVVVETSAGEPNYWFPYTPGGQASVTLTGFTPLNGPVAGGTVVTLSGSGFADPSSVTFGGVPATKVTYVGPTELTAVSPAGSGVLPVEVEDWMGTAPAGGNAVFSYLGTQTTGALVPLPPTRICDTRPGNPSHLSGSAAQCDGMTLAANSPLTVQVAGIGAVPAQGATSAVLNVTVTGPLCAGYLTVYPAGQPAPPSSNLNFVAQQTVANLVTVGLSAQGQVSLVTPCTGVDVVVDVEGYYSTALVSGAGLYSGVTPSRICDSRAGNPSRLSGTAAQCTGKTLGPGKSIEVQVAGIGGVPAGAAAAVLNVTATDTSAASYLTVFPGGTPPTASSLNWSAGATVANQMVVPLSGSGTVSVYNASGEADVVVDVFGYFSSSGGTGARFSPLPTPVRLCDTRSGQPANPCTGKTLGAGAELAVQIGGASGIPAAATAVVLNVTVANGTDAGYLAVFPAGSVPLISNVNWPAREVVPNAVTVELNQNGGITIYNHSGAVDVVVDVYGYFG